MKPKVIEPKYQVYLLHFDEPIGRVQHYVGMCKGPRLHWRLLDHRNGRGAALTARAYEQGIGFSLARTWQADSPDKEKEIKASKGFKDQCPVCNPEKFEVPLDHVFKHYDAIEPRLPFTPLDVETGKRQSRYQK